MAKLLVKFAFFSLYTVNLVYAPQSLPLSGHPIPAGACLGGDNRIRLEASLESWVSVALMDATDDVPLAKVTIDPDQATVTIVDESGGVREKSTESAS